MSTKIYALNQNRTLQHTAVAPGALDRTATVPEWFDADGNPVTINVTFKYGEAVVDDALGRFMVAHKMAAKSRPLFTHNGEAAAA